MSWKSSLREFISRARTRSPLRRVFAGTRAAGRPDADEFVVSDVPPLAGSTLEPFGAAHDALVPAPEGHPTSSEGLLEEPLHDMPLHQEPLGEEPRREPAPVAAPAAGFNPDDWDRLLDEINERLMAQQAQTRRLIEPITGLSGAAAALVEIKTQSARMLDLLADQVAQARAREQSEKAVDEAVGRLGDASARQGETLQQVRQQVDANTQAIRRAAESYESVTENLQEVLRGIVRAHEDLSVLARTLEVRDSKLARSVAAIKVGMFGGFGLLLAAILAWAAVVLAVR